MEEQTELTNETEITNMLGDECDSVDNVFQNKATALLYLALLSLVAYGMLATFSLLDG